VKNPMEKFDLLDCAGRKTGELISRDDAHRSGAWHGAFHCLIVYMRDGRGRVLFQKRSVRKKIAPQKLDVSVGGHYSAGEDARTAGPREIREELGLDVRFEDLLPLGRRIFVYCFDPGIREYEFQDVFLLHRQINPADMSLQKEEVEALLEMEVDQGAGLLSGEVPRIECSTYASSGSAGKAVITADMFVPCLDSYYLKLLLLAARYLRGERSRLVI
jgi:isopentenyldiphosphate isomerase